MPAHFAKFLGPGTNLAQKLGQEIMSSVAVLPGKKTKKIHSST